MTNLHMSIDEACRGVPLLQLSKDSPCRCISCDKQYVKSETGEFSVYLEGTNSSRSQPKNIDIVEYKKDTDDIKTALGPLIDISNAPILNFAQHDDDPSNLIAKKMLQGYTLIDTICSRSTCSGNIPLLRDKTGQLHCVFCDAVNEGKGDRVKKSSPVLETGTWVDKRLDDSSFDDADDEAAYSEYMKTRLTGIGMLINSTTSIHYHHQHSFISAIQGTKDESIKPIKTVPTQVLVSNGTAPMTTPHIAAMGVNKYSSIVTALEAKLQAAVDSLTVWYVTTFLFLSLSTYPLLMTTLH